MTSWASPQGEEGPPIKGRAPLSATVGSVLRMTAEACGRKPPGPLVIFLRKDLQRARSGGPDANPDFAHHNLVDVRRATDSEVSETAISAGYSALHSWLLLWTACLPLGVSQPLAKMILERLYV